VAHPELTECCPRKNRRRDLDELETRLITADVGTEATGRILEELRRRVARKELDDVDALLKALHDAMFDIFEARGDALRVDPNIKPYVILVVESTRRQDHDHRPNWRTGCCGRAQRHAGRRRYLSRGKRANSWRSGPSATRCRSSLSKAARNLPPSSSMRFRPRARATSMC